MARIRLTVAQANELPTMLTVLRQITVRSDRADPDGLTGPVRKQREQLPPTGHPRRAAFFGNRVPVFASVDKSARPQQTIVLASVALPDAEDRPTAEALVEAAMDK